MFFLSVFLLLFHYLHARSQAPACEGLYRIYYVYYAGLGDSSWLVTGCSSNWLQLVAGLDWTTKNQFLVAQSGFIEFGNLNELVVVPVHSRNG
jgi:hypothetical protein